jgi:hypothetical protein
VHKLTAGCAANLVVNVTGPTGMTVVAVEVTVAE